MSRRGLWGDVGVRVNDFRLAEIADKGMALVVHEGVCSARPGACVNAKWRTVISRSIV